MTRRTSQLEDNNETVEVVAASPAPTRRSTRTRKHTMDESFDFETSGRRNTRRGSAINESEAQQIQVGTPQRITRRSASIQSEDGNIALPQVVQKQPSEVTIQEEELPISRRTRASSVTSDDGSVINTGTPKKRGRKSLGANLKSIEPVIEEIEESPVRPVTRSMSQSPANVSAEKSSPSKPKSPIVTKTSEQLEGAHGNADETITTIVEEVSRKLSNGGHMSPDIHKSPVVKTKTPRKNDSLLSSGKKGGDKTPDKSVIEATTPQSATKTPKSTNKSPVDKSPTVTSGKKSHSTPASKSASKKSPKTEYLSQTPQPPKVDKEDKAVFSKSWSQPVHGSAAVTPKIDAFGMKQSQITKSASISSIKVQRKTVHVSSSDESDEPDTNFEEFVLDEAEEVPKDYQSGDSMDEDEKGLAEENRMHEELGEDIGSEDSDSVEDEEYDNDSFIASEGNDDPFFSDTRKKLTFFFYLQANTVSSVTVTKTNI